jgi:hypothetical protein
LKVTGVGSGALVSRTQPSCSTRMCWIKTAFVFASRSAIGWYSDTQQLKTWYETAFWPVSSYTSITRSRRKFASDVSRPLGALA